MGEQDRKMETSIKQRRVELEKSIIVATSSIGLPLSLDFVGATEEDAERERENEQFRDTYIIYNVIWIYYTFFICFWKNGTCCFTRII